MTAHFSTFGPAHQLPQSIECIDDTCSWFVMQENGQNIGAGVMYDLQRFANLMEVMQHKT